MKVYISGGWSYGNIGDEAIAEATIYLTEKYFSNHSFIYTSYNPKNFYEQHGKEAITSLHKYLEDYNIEDMDRARKLVDDGKLDECLCEIDNNTLLIMSGGGYVCQNWKSQIITQILLIEIAKKRNAKVISICQSIGPILDKSLEKQLADAIKAIEYISVRDDCSATYLNSIGVKRPIDIVPDLAVVISDLITSKQSKCDTISIMPACYTKYQSIDPKISKNILSVYWEKVINKAIYYRYRAFWISLLKLLRNEKIEFVMSTTWGADERFLEYIIDKSGIKNYIVCKNHTIQEMALNLAKNKLTISSKMHPLIISSSYSVPTLGISYNFKTNYYMSSINRASYCYNNNCLNSQQIYKDITSDDVKAVDKTIMDDRKRQVYSMFEKIYNI